jgi:hypothetical protein
MEDGKGAKRKGEFLTADFAKLTQMEGREDFDKGGRQSFPKIAQTRKTAAAKSQATQKRNRILDRRCRRFTQMGTESFSREKAQEPQRVNV